MWWPTHDNDHDLDYNFGDHYGHDDVYDHGKYHTFNVDYIEYHKVNDDDLNNDYYYDYNLYDHYQNLIDS